MVLEGLHGEALHRGEWVVVGLNQNLYSNFQVELLSYLPTPMSRKIGVVSSAKKL